MLPKYKPLGYVIYTIQEAKFMGQIRTAQYFADLSYGQTADASNTVWHYQVTFDGTDKIQTIPEASVTHVLEDSGWVEQTPTPATT